MKNKIWYCYQLNERVNKLGNPYIGKTCDIKKRADKWKKYYQLDYIPIDLF